MNEKLSISGNNESRITCCPDESVLQFLKRVSKSQTTLWDTLHYKNSLGRVFCKSLPQIVCIGLINEINSFGFLIALEYNKIAAVAYNVH